MSDTESGLPELWGIQYRNMFASDLWSDWEPFVTTGDEWVLRFLSREQAERVVVEVCEHIVHALDTGRRRYEATSRLLKRREKALKAAGLWVCDGEEPADVLRLPEAPPRRQSLERVMKQWCVVPDQDMETPAVHHRDGCFCDSCIMDAGSPPLFFPRASGVSDGQCEVEMVFWALHGVKVRSAELVVSDYPMDVLHF